LKMPPKLLPKASTDEGTKVSISRDAILVDLLHRNC
jgi:hypothetical protein